MTSAVSRDEIVELVDHLVHAVDPLHMTRAEFLSARFDAGLAWVSFPRRFGGLGCERRLQRDVEKRFSEHSCPSPNEFSPIAFGTIGPTVMAHGSDEQRLRFLRPMFIGTHTWCLLQSEPGAGSDLSAISTRADRDGESWVVNGQKVWTSLAHVADFGLLFARTDRSLPRRAGLTCFIVDMRAPGVDIRALRQMTGEAEFNEVFFTDVVIPETQRVGQVNDGWQVVQTSLRSEREVLGEGVATSLVPQMTSEVLRYWIAKFAALPEWERAVRRDALMQEYIQAAVLDFCQRRSAALEGQTGAGLPPSLLKLMNSRVTQGMSSMFMNLMGAEGMLFPHGYDMIRPDYVNRFEDPQYFFIRCRSHSIGGGTSEIQRNALASQHLRLPPEPRSELGPSGADAERKRSANRP